mgnify:CR=1 FL=1
MTPAWPQRCPWCAELTLWFEAARDRVECRRRGCGWHDKQPPRPRGIRDVEEAETCESSP